MSAARIGIAAARQSESVALEQLAQSAGYEIAFSVHTAAELATKGATVPLVLVAHGALDASGPATELAGRGVAVVVAVVDPKASIDGLYRATAKGGVEVTQLLDTAAIGAILARHNRRAPRPSVLAPRVQAAPVFAISASAGGPEALAEVLGHLASDLSLRIVVAQHIGPTFTAGLASWLASTTGRRVEVADEGRALTTDAALVVRSDRQPWIGAGGVVRYRALDPNNPFHPCIDTLLSSLAATDLRGAAALLTGMGSDGAAGLLALRQAGWTTIAQDAESSRVFGMPRAAARLGAATHVVALDRIGAIASRVLRAEAGARA